MNDHPLDGIARAIFTKALDTDRAGELLDCLFNNGSVTIDARNGDLVIVDAATLTAMEWEP